VCGLEARGPSNPCRVLATTRSCTASLILLCLRRKLSKAATQNEIQKEVVLVYFDSDTELNPTSVTPEKVSLRLLPKQNAIKAHGV